MNEMIERVAAALEPKCRAFGKGDMPMQVAREFARAAIEAMREPTTEMILAAQFAVPAHSSAREADISMYRAMIDVALADPMPVFDRLTDDALGSKPVEE